MVVLMSLRSFYLNTVRWHVVRFFRFRERRDAKRYARHIKRI